MPTPCFNQTPLFHQSSGPHVFLSLSPPFQADPLECRGWVHFPAQTSKTLWRRCSAPSPHREGAWGLCEQSKPRAGALLAFCINQGISASFSLLYFLIGRLRTTKFQSIKGPQQVGSPCSSRDSQVSSPTPQVKSINPLALSFLYSPTLTSIRDYWKNHSLD